ncbi:hypothetical protein EDF31_104266 [Curtobacterium sp. PhB142]|uniref:hypothetical protein n=1 Tax=unclassified Curtobacterium TaxID=257496 RepID=UPI0010483913|nr:MULTISPECIES: hypothetical protein [unclassified Curtobacterium]TCL86371.1 hypothetical protein EDF31_104266 [Curtobacterium sp. PhB142]TCM02561.1 hypothetical protein EDF26_104266 [Curtobacterium sp. PhB134]
MEHRSRTVLRAVRDAVLVAVGSVAIGLVIVIAGLGWLDDMPYRGSSTEAAYIAVAVAAVAVCGFGALVGLAAIRASVSSSDGARRAGSRRSAPDR